MTIVLQIVRPVDGLTCCVSTLNFAAVHRSVLVTKRYLLSMLVVKSKIIIEKMEMMKMMDMNDAHRLRPPSPPLDVLSHFVASWRTVEHGRLQPKQTYCLYLEFLYYCVTQLMLYTGDKLSSTIFCCLSVCQASVTPDQISTFSNIYRHTSPLLTMYHLIPSSTNLY